MQGLLLDNEVTMTFIYGLVLLPSILGPFDEGRSLG